MDLILMLCLIGMALGLFVATRKDPFAEPVNPKGGNSQPYSKYLRDLSSSQTPRLPVRTQPSAYPASQVVVYLENPTKPEPKAEVFQESKIQTLSQRPQDFTPCMHYKSRGVTS